MLHWLGNARMRLIAPRFTAALIATVGLMLLPLQSSTRSATIVDLILVLALDVSGSVDQFEFELQQRGLAEAIRNPAVLQTIRRGGRKRIAVIAVQWAGTGRQEVSVPWQIIGDRAAAEQFSADLMRTPRAFLNSQTDLTGVIDYCVELAVSAPFAAPRMVIDISGDGMDNVQYAPHRARDRAVLAGITVNGLAILNDAPWLDRYYRQNVIGGHGAFVMKAKDYEAYTVAILRKLLREIDQHFVT